MTGPACSDCVSEGVTTRRKVATVRGRPVPASRCATHHRAVSRGRKDAAWEKRLMATYGITADEYWMIYDLQGGVCYICTRATGARKRLSVDHCHATGVIRGLLCSSCNRNVLGHLRDEVAAFIRGAVYLKAPPAFDVIGERVAPVHLTPNGGRLDN